MKKIFIDPGDFYTKTVVYDDSGKGSVFLGRSFFPTLAKPVQEKRENILYYEQGGGYYKLGNDCNELTVNDFHKKISKNIYNEQIGSLILKKIIFDYAEDKDDLEIEVVIGSPEKLKIFSSLRETMSKDLHMFQAFRGYDKKSLTKSARIKIDFKSAGDGIFELLRKIKEKFTSALVVDIGYISSRVYVISAKQGVEVVKLIENGAGDYLKSIAKLMESGGLKNISFLWMVKQMESGCREIDTAGNGENFVVDLVMDNIRWDLNKIFYASISDIITSYFNNTTKWFDMLVIMGGGAAWSGDLLRHSLMEGGFKFNDFYIEKSAIYPLLQGMGQTQEKMDLKVRKAL